MAKYSHSRAESAVVERFGRIWGTTGTPWLDADFLRTGHAVNHSGRTDVNFEHSQGSR